MTMRYVAMQSIVKFTKIKVDDDCLVCFIEIDVIVVVMRLLEYLLLEFFE